MNTLLEQHLTELESHNRELIAMNAKLRKENEAMLALLNTIDNTRAIYDCCPVCLGTLQECKPSCEGKQLTEVLGY